MNTTFTYKVKLTSDVNVTEYISELNNVVNITQKRNNLFIEAKPLLCITEMIDDVNNKYPNSLVFVKMMT
jgi:hypothetical protein